MSQLVLNESLHLTYPEGFHVMNEEELADMAFLQKGPGECLTDPERHCILSIGWRKGSGFSFLFLKAKEIAEHDEKLVKKAMEPFQYTFEGFSSRTVGGEQAEGFCYSYVAKEQNMSAESIVFKYKKFFYYLHVYSRSEMRGENFSLWEEILKNLTLS